MTSIDQHSLEMGAADPWIEVVTTTRAWAGRHALNLRDVVLLLPFAQLLPLARRAFGEAGGWMPRIETTRSLALALGPAEAGVHGQISFDVGLDRLVAERMLRAQPWASDWPAEDARGFVQAVAALVETAHAIARAAASLAPEQRAPHWQAARGVLSLPAAGTARTGTRERLLARVALEWAAAAPSPASVALFDLRPAGWVVLQAGGADPLARNLLMQAAGHTPGLWLQADVDPFEPFAYLTPSAPISVSACDDFENEAQRTTATVLQHVRAGTTPVALIAQDRMLVRRVRALLGRQRLSLRDETGWKLSTTRAGASVRLVLSCARPDASTDDWIEWIKVGPPPHGTPRPSSAGHGAAVEELERELRARRQHRARAVDPQDLPLRAAMLWRRATATLEPLARQTLADLGAWLSALAAALHGIGQRAWLDADDAGRQVLAALGLGESATPALASASAIEAMDLDGFIRWMDTVLEHASFVPESTAEADVVVTPMARALLRPFAAVVLPGADARHLGAFPEPTGLLSDAECRALGMPDRQARWDAELCAFALVLRLPRLSLLHRRSEEGEPLTASPWLDRLKIELRRRQTPPSITTAADPRIVATLTTTPFARPLPRAPGLLPRRLSASACEALRVCPYRFFALGMLKLGSTNELDAELEKRDYGTWLHAVLQRFHAQRTEPDNAASETARLHAFAQEVLREQHPDAADFLPYEATFARFVPRYIRWLHQRDKAGAQWLDAERTLTVQPPEWGNVEMHGVIDRVDFIPEDGRPITQLIDYKTGRALALRDNIRQGEDTQLAFYAALMAAQSDSPGELGAMYLALDESDKIHEVVHPGVEASGRALVEGVGHELARLAAGAALPALGEGSACDVCDARGLCRRDHWSAVADPDDRAA